MNKNKKHKNQNIMPITKQTYKAVLNQPGEDIPEVSVFENGFTETPTLSRDSAGKFFLTFTNPTLPGNQTYIIFPQNNGASADFSANRVDVNRVMITTAYNGELSDGLMIETAIEVTVYSGWIE